MESVKNISTFYIWVKNFSSHFTLLSHLVALNELLDSL